MSKLKRLLLPGALVLGGVGVVVCVALVVGVGIGDARASRTTQTVFEKLDSTLETTSDRVTRVKQRVDEAALTADDVQQSLARLAKQEAAERLGERLDVAGKADRLAGALEHADQWMETSEASIDVVRRSIGLANRFGASVDPGSVDKLQTELSSLRAKLQGAQDLVDRLREHTGPGEEGGVIRQRLVQAAEIALRIVAALGVVQSRLEQFQARIETTRQELPKTERQIYSWIHTAAILLTLFLLWMLAGQVALCRYGWVGLRR